MAGTHLHQGRKGAHHDARERPDHRSRSLRRSGAHGRWLHTCRRSTARTRSLQFGKEFGNRGQCNPTYFTVGNLVKYLCTLRDQHGMSTEHIIKNYVLLTAGACGPCRFGMYVTEYRKALRDAGFDGFRVVLFQQTGGFSRRPGRRSGLEMTPPFFWAMVKALVAGDVLNALGYRIRPYEVTAGDTDRRSSSRRRSCTRRCVSDPMSCGRCWRCKPLLGPSGSRPNGAEAEDERDRRVLGDDHRGRRQLPACSDSSKGRAPKWTFSSSRRGSSTCSGRQNTTRKRSPRPQSGRCAKYGSRGWGRSASAKRSSISRGGEVAIRACFSSSRRRRAFMDTTLRT